MPIGVYDHYKQRGKNNGNYGRKTPRVILTCIGCGTPREYTTTDLRIGRQWFGKNDSGEFAFYRCRKCHLEEVTGVPRPEEICKKISKTKEGVVFSEEHIRKLGEAARNGDPKLPGSLPPCSEERKRKLREANEGKTVPEEVCRRISKTMSERLREIGRENGYHTGWYDSEKFDCRMFFRSSFEKKAFEIFEEYDRVVFLKSESIVLPYMKDDKVRHYVVDLHLQLNSGEEFLVEIKPSALLDQPLNVLKFDIAKEYADRTGMFFCVLTEKELTDINSVETKLMEAISF